MKKILMMAAICLMAAAVLAAQCAATTKKGTQCKRQASPGSSYCWQHGGTTKAERAAGSNAASAQTCGAAQHGENSGTQPITVADGRCQATTKAGTQCKRKAKQGSKFCFQHGTTTHTSASDDVETAKEPAATETQFDGQCTAKKKDGSQCKRKAKRGSRFCWQHEK